MRPPLILPSGWPRACVAQIGWRPPSLLAACVTARRSSNSEMPERGSMSPVSILSTALHWPPCVIVEYRRAASQ